MPHFPYTRLRRNRKAPWVRSLLAENHLSVNDLILPLFICNGERTKTSIEHLPDIYRYSPDLILQEVDKALQMGIKAVMLFPFIEHDLKDAVGSEALNESNLICNTIKAIKEEFGDEIGVIADVALDPYTSHGHDGILNEDGIIDNDETISSLCEQALTLANAGCDMVAPSDMMDGRVGSIRENLDAEEFENVQILAHSAKFRSALYGPFRNAIGSNKVLQGDKATYQLAITNSNEALIEAELDIDEGADIIMIKPATLYLDIIRQYKDRYKLPIFAYHVSGEYAILKASAQAGIINYDDVLIEQLMAIKRAGASAIVTYATLEVAQILKKHNNII